MEVHDEMIDTLQKQLNEALEALRFLHDYQNGPPLIKYERQWQAAMTAAELVLHKHGK